MSGLCTAATQHSQKRPYIQIRHGCQHVLSAQLNCLGMYNTIAKYFELNQGFFKASSPFRGAIKLSP